MEDLSQWTARAAPQLTSLNGRFVHIVRAQFPGDATALFAALGGAQNDNLWRYIPFGPFESPAALSADLATVIAGQNWMTYILRAPDAGAVLGMASYMRIRPEAGSAEIGCIMFSKKLQRTPAATEAIYLMARHLFDDLGYRRYEWKCDDRNEASKKAALRLGFTFEGVFRQDMVVKGENRDTAWYSMIDNEWPTLKAAFEAWLALENFDDQGRQKQSLGEIRGAL